MAADPVQLPTSGSWLAFLTYSKPTRISVR